ncbi:MAG TPA: TIGR00730 family Rossman fold protein [Candidatus Aquilonibacter sp.]|nr:TIGR00730 family Rossman fold protein [Candidatus Aquilonibacter sp.]
MPRISIFCGAHAGETPVYRNIATAATRALVAAGYGIVYGGGRVGLMGAVADAALDADGEVIGVIPHALATAEVAHHGVTQLHVVQSMHERKALMADLCDGFLALPGGYGTMDEFHEILTWRQLGIHNKPIVLFNVEGYYDALLALYERMLDDGFVREHNRHLFTPVATVDAMLSAFDGTPYSAE